MTEIICSNCGESTANLNTISLGKKFVEENNGICQEYQEKIFTCENCFNIHISNMKVGSPYRENKKHRK